MKPLIRKVSKGTGVNPVARAVAKQMLQRSITDYKIAFYMLDEGASCANLTDTIALPIRALMHAMAHYDTPDYRKLMSADIVLAELWERGTWRKADVVTLDNAMGILLERWPSLDPVVANNAIRYAQKEMLG